MTNKAKYEQLETLIQQKDQSYIDEYFRGKERPSVVYEVRSWRHVERWAVTGIRCHHKAMPYLWNSKKVTNADLAALKAFYDTIAHSPECIFLQVAYDNVSAAFNITHIDSVRLAYKEEDLAPHIDHLRVLYAPRDGHFACHYCGKQTPDAQKIVHTIHFRAWNSLLGRQALKSEPMEFCSGTCAAHEQMGCEG